MRRTIVVVFSLLALTGCTDIIPATREEAYEFRYLQPGNNLSFLWSREELPVKFWVDPDGPLYEPTRIALERWASAVLYGEFRGILVADSIDADVVINNAQPFVEPDPDPNPEELRIFRSNAPQCTGETDFDLDVTAKTIRLPVQVYVFNNGNQDPTALARCYRLTTTHEVGHALGILNHSPNPADIMYANPVVDELSRADQQTFEVMFHTIPTLTIVR